MAREGGEEEKRERESKTRDEEDLENKEEGYCGQLSRREREKEREGRKVT